jgi:transcriptional regulator with XRE-family HTH domain
MQPIADMARDSRMPMYRHHVQTATWTHGSDLRAWREQQGISQERAGRLVGVTVKAYGDWERGKTVPGPDRLRAIVEHLGAPPEVVGYEAPRGYEFLPADWIRQELAAVEERARLRHDETMQALRDLLVEIKAWR